MDQVPKNRGAVARRAVQPPQFDRALHFRKQACSGNDGPRGNTPPTNRDERGWIDERAASKKGTRRGRGNAARRQFPAECSGSHRPGDVFDDRADRFKLAQVIRQLALREALKKIPLCRAI